MAEEKSKTEAEKTPPSPKKIPPRRGPQPRQHQQRPGPQKFDLLRFLMQHKILVLVGCGLFLLILFFIFSGVNSGKYYITASGEHILIKKGVFFPVGRGDFTPAVNSEAYTPIYNPKKRVLKGEETFGDISALNNRLFNIIFELAESEIYDPKTSDFKLAEKYLLRSKKVPGIGNLKRSRLKGMAGDIKYRLGLSIMKKVEDHLRNALKQFKKAYELGTQRFTDVADQIQEVQRQLKKRRAMEIRRRSLKYRPRSSIVLPKPPKSVIKEPIYGPKPFVGPDLPTK